MAITTYLTAKNYGLPFTAIPVFPVRAFHHGAVTYNTNSGIKEPKDVEGKKAGVRAYTVTTGVWARGILTAEYGVDWSKVDITFADEEHVEAFMKDAPSNVPYELGAELAKMLADNEIQVGLGLGRAEADQIKPLIPNAREAAVESYKKTGVYPINHMIVVKDELLSANPWLAEALFEVFKAAKQSWEAKTPAADRSTLRESTVEGDPFPYGIEPNRKTLEAIISHASDAKILTKPFTVEEVFAPSTVGLTA
jgi:4,5-dihydroxyphthalate decarboxylase